MRTDTLKPQRVAVVVNPTKTQAVAARDAVVIACRKGGWADPTFYETTLEDPGYGQTRRALEDGADVVVAAGGDGTIRAVSESLVGSHVPLGLVPLGTGNLLARNLGADLGDPYLCVDVALFGSQKAIDTISFRTEGERGHVREQRFVVMGGAGFDAQIMADTKDDLKDRLGWVAYGEAAGRHLFSRPGWARYRVDGGQWTSRRVRSVMVCNCGELTAGIVLVPNARIDDGVLDLVIMSPRTMLGWIGMAANVLFRHRHDLPVLTFDTGREVRVEFHEPIESEIDGDPIGRILAFDSRVDPGSLLVRVPPSQADAA